MSAGAGGSVLVSPRPRGYPHPKGARSGRQGRQVPALALPDKGVLSMPTISPPRKPARANGPRGRRLRRTGCGFFCTRTATRGTVRGKVAGAPVSACQSPAVPLGVPEGNTGLMSARTGHGEDDCSVTREARECG